MTLLVAPTPTATATRSLRLEQTIRYGYDVPVTDVRQRLVTVPPAVHGHQHRTRWSLTVSGLPAGSPVRRRTHRDPFGNTVVELDVPRVDAGITLDCRVTVTQHVPIGPHRTGWDPRFLAPSALTAPDDAIRALAAPTAAEICARTYRAFAYEWGVTGVHTTAADALHGGRGVCQDYAHVMIAACRTAGIAARYVSGHLVGEGGSHAWVEVLTPDPTHPGRCVVEAWDPTHDRPTDHRYLTVAVGRDYADVAPISGAYIADRPVDHLRVTKRLTAA